MVLALSSDATLIASIGALLAGLGAFLSGIAALRISRLRQEQKREDGAPPAS